MTPLVLAMAVSTAVFPTLAEESASNHPEAVREVFMLSLRTILFLTIPMAVGLITLGEPLIRLLFEHGAFTAESTRLTQYALTFYAIGLAGHATVEIVDRVFYAVHDTWTPVKAASMSFRINLVLGLTLMWTPLNFGGLALANSLAALSEATLLMVMVRRRIPGSRNGPDRRHAFANGRRQPADGPDRRDAATRAPRSPPLRDVRGASDCRSTGRPGGRHGLLRLLVSSTIGRVTRAASARPSPGRVCATTTLMGLAA